MNTINPHSWVTSHRDTEFKKALLQSDALIPDGTGIVFAVRWLFGIRIRKMAGADLHRHVLQQLDKVAGSVFYLGASQRTLTHITERIHAEHPHIRVNTYSPPYRDRFSEEETAAMIAAVNAFKPDVLFVGTTPRPPQWMIAMGLEWLGRLIKEPRRMWKRNFVSTPKYLSDIVRLKLKKKNNKKTTPDYEIN